MNIENRIEAFSKLGDHLKSLSENQLDELCWKAANGNSWFTEENVKRSIKGITLFLSKESLNDWLSNYHLPVTTKTVGTVMAGNIPLVGFHDLLCVLISGHRLMIKMSSQDSYLMSYIIEQLYKINPEFQESIIKVDQLKGMDAIIATGSDNTARYFEYYFGKYPNIIRKNRSSCAIIKGDENPEELGKLGKDIFYYFGLGCRNISKLFIPEEFNLSQFFEAIEQYSEVNQHHKYRNNYDYNKSIYLVNCEKHLDNGFLLLKESEQLVSPISVLFYEKYKSTEHLDQLITGQLEKIQCIVSSEGWYPNSVNFGEAQYPSINDYADHVDTLRFLSDI